MPLSQEALVILRSLDSFLSSPWVFPGIKSNPQPIDSRAFFRRAFEPALKKAGIQNASWHTLRHTTASRLVMASVPLQTVKEVLGHRNIQSTLRYAQLAQSHIQAAMEKGSLANLGIGTGSKTGSGVKDTEEEKTQVVDVNGAPDRNRTCNPWIRSPILYPIELRAHTIFIYPYGGKLLEGSTSYTGTSEDPSTLKQ